MKIKLSFILLCCFILGCSSTYFPPLPETLNITPVSPDVSSEVAAFVGIWEGKWGASQDAIIVVEKINNQKAELIFSRGSKGAGGFGFANANSYSYITASVMPGPIIEWRNDIKPSSNPGGSYQCPCKLTLKLTKDRDILVAYFEYIDYGYKLRADFRKRK